MTPISLAILCFVGGAVLLVAELLLPSHGVLGVASVIALLVGVGACFWVNQFVGLGAAVALVVAAPLMFAIAVKVWPHTPTGKRLILGSTQASQARVATPTVQVGEIGVVVSELRPGGVCDFGPARVEARCEHGTIPAGTRVEVVAITDGRRPLVRGVSA